MVKYIELNTRTTQYILPWDAQVITYAIADKKIRANQLCFDNQREKKQLSHDLFLLAAKDSVSGNTGSISPLALIARALMN
jgi:hypothetical protein